MRKEAVLAELE